MKPLRSLSIRLNSASEMPAFFASSFDICLSPLKSIFLKLYFLTTVGFAPSGAGVVTCEKTVIGNKQAMTVAILINFFFILQVNYVFNFTIMSK